MTKNKKDNSNTIALNKKARHDYFIEQNLEAGLSLQGWEVKSLRENKVQIKESYVILKNNELFLFGEVFIRLFGNVLKFFPGKIQEVFPIFLSNVGSKRFENSLL